MKIRKRFFPRRSRELTGLPNKSLGGVSRRKVANMKHNWIWPLLIGVLVGVAIGFPFGTWFIRSAEMKGSPFFREFSFSAVAPKAGETNWKVITDKVHEPFPPFGRPQRISRLIVAHDTTMSDAEQDRAFAQLSKAVFERAAAYGAIIRGADGRNYWSARAEPPARSQLNLQRKYYSIGEIQGVVDVWCLAESGGVTVIIQLIEGP